jgi:hypothetical protein
MGPVVKISLDSEKMVMEETQVIARLASTSIETPKEDTVSPPRVESAADLTPRTSLFKYTSGKVSASARMDDLQVLSRSISNECDAIAVTENFILFPVQGGIPNQF